MNMERMATPPMHLPIVARHPGRFNSMVDHTTDEGLLLTTSYMITFDLFIVLFLLIKYRNKLLD